MILGLEELKFIFNPVTRLCYGEFEARLARLMWSLKEKRKVVVKKRKKRKKERDRESFILHCDLLRRAEQFTHLDSGF